MIELFINIYFFFFFQAVLFEELCLATDPNKFFVNIFLTFSRHFTNIFYIIENPLGTLYATTKLERKMMYICLYFVNV